MQYHIELRGVCMCLAQDFDTTFEIINFFPDHPCVSAITWRTIYESVDQLQN